MDEKWFDEGCSDNNIRKELVSNTTISSVLYEHQIYIGIPNTYSFLLL